MPILRNPFARRHETAQNELARPHTPTGGKEEVEFNTPSRAAILRSTSTGSEPGEYQLSEISDEGVFLQPSPATSKRSFWYSRSNGSTASSSFRSAANEHEPFSISRESFDSYRRSFDISARSPVVDPASSPFHRASLDSRRTRMLPPPMLSDRHVNVPESQPEETLEDIALENETAKPKKRNIFARFGDSDAHPEGTTRPGSSGQSAYSIFGRKRGHSGQGAELGAMPSVTSHRS